MPRRRELKGIAGGIASKFSSRYNDVDGYWALGIIYKHSVECGSKNFVLDILSGESIPDYEHSNYLAVPYREYLFSQMEKKGFKPEQVRKAKVKVEFNCEASKIDKVYRVNFGEPFACIIKLTDDLGRCWISKYRDWCRQHDSAKEQRSTRRYAS